MYIYMLLVCYTYIHILSQYTKCAQARGRPSVGSEPLPLVAGDSQREEEECMGSSYRAEALTLCSRDPPDEPAATVDPSE